MKPIGDTILELSGSDFEVEVSLAVYNSIPFVNIVSDEYKRVAVMLKSMEKKIDSNIGQGYFNVIFIPPEYESQVQPFSPQYIKEIFKKYRKKRFDIASKLEKAKIIAVDLQAYSLKREENFSRVVLNSVTEIAEPSSKEEIEEIGNSYINHNITFITVSPKQLNVDIVHNIYLEPLSEGEIKYIIEQNMKIFEATYKKQISLKNMNAIIKNLKGLKFQQIERAIKFFLRRMYANNKKEEELLHLIEDIKIKELRSANLSVLEPVAFDEVGGLNNLKKYLLRVKKNYELFFFKEKNKPGIIKNIPIPKGILLTGVPGSGKSLTAKALGHLLELPVVQFEFQRMESKWFGETESNVINSLKTIDALSPVVVFIDEIEKMFGNQNSSHEVTQKVLGILLTWLQESNNGNYIVATSNNIDLLPIELTRAGRWDATFFFDLPKEEERMQIAKIHIDKYFSTYPEWLASFIASKTEGYTGSEIEQIIKDTARVVIDEENVYITKDLVSSVIENIVPISKTMPDKIEKIRALKNRGFLSAN